MTDIELTVNICCCLLDVIVVLSRLHVKCAKQKDLNIWWTYKIIYDYIVFFFIFFCLFASFSQMAYGGVFAYLSPLKHLIFLPRVRSFL